MPLESSVFVENCHNELLGYFRKHNSRKTEFFSSQMTKFFTTQTARIRRTMVLY